MKARQTGHLIELALTNGALHSLDPSDVCEVGTPQGQRGVTLVRCRGQTWAHFVRGDYETVLGVLRAALESAP